MSTAELQPYRELRELLLKKERISKRLDENDSQYQKLDNEKNDNEELARSTESAINKLNADYQDKLAYLEHQDFPEEKPERSTLLPYKRMGFFMPTVVLLLLPFVLSFIADYYRNFSFEGIQRAVVIILLLIVSIVTRRLFDHDPRPFDIFGQAFLPEIGKQLLLMFLAFVCFVFPFLGVGWILLQMFRQNEVLSITLAAIIVSLVITLIVFKVQRTSISRKNAQAEKEYELALSQYEKSASEFERERPARILSAQTWYQKNISEKINVLDAYIAKLEGLYAKLEKQLEAIFEDREQLNLLEAEMADVRIKIPIQQLHNSYHYLDFIIEKIEYGQAKTIPDAFTLLEQEIRANRIVDEIHNSAEKITHTINQNQAELRELHRVEVNMQRQQHAEMLSEMNTLRNITSDNMAALSAQINQNSNLVQQNSEKLDQLQIDSNKVKRRLGV